ncbi:MAG: [citrate (pro-3S)-lyase] ligase [Ezakiella massiliensis]
MDLDFEKKAFEEFLESQGIHFEDADEFFVMRDQGKIIASGAYKDSVIKLLAVDNKYREEGYLPKMITHIKDQLYKNGVETTYIYTKPEYESMFKSLGYEVFAKTDQIVLLLDNFHEYDDFIQRVNDSGKFNACIVMNANPFTWGHRKLVEYAARSISNVIIFVVEENKSKYSFEDRFKMVEDGLTDIWCEVMPGGKFIISDMTFPSYFLKDDTDIARAHASLDAEIFVSRIAKDLGIRQRYVAKEPFDKMTAIYNEELKKRQHPLFELVEIDRYAIDGEIVSASKVRELEAEGKDYSKYVPETTREIMEKVK